MPLLNIPDEISERLAKRAAASNVTIEELIAKLLDLGESGALAQVSPQCAESFSDWNRKFESWMAEVQARADRYPPGFVMDDSRESIYQGCGE